MRLVDWRVHAYAGRTAAGEHDIGSAQVICAQPVDDARRIAVGSVGAGGAHGMSLVDDWALERLAVDFGQREIGADRERQAFDRRWLAWIAKGDDGDPGCDDIGRNISRDHAHFAEQQYLAAERSGGACSPAAVFATFSRNRATFNSLSRSALESCGLMVGGFPRLLRRRQSRCVRSCWTLGGSQRCI